MTAMIPIVFRFAVPGSIHEPHPAVLRALIGNPGVRVGVWIGAGMTVGIGVYDTLWARFLKDLGASTKFVGLSLTIFGLPIIFFSGLAGRLADRFGPAKIGALALMGSAPFVLGYAFLHNVWIIAGLAFFHSAFDAGVVPSSQSQVARSVPEDLVAAGQGLLEGVGLLVAAISAGVAAPLYGQFGARVVWSGLALCVVGCALGATNAQRNVTAKIASGDGINGWR